MLNDDAFLELQARCAALEYVAKLTLQVIHQLAPNAGAHQAMLTMLEHSIDHAHIETDDPRLADEMRDYVKQYATQIIDAGFNARSAT